MNNRTFFGDNLFEVLCKETNLYYFQNQGKYDSSFKVLKWVDVSVIHATQKKGVKPGTSASSAYHHSTKRNVSRDIASSSITRSLDKCFLKILGHKIN
jgi:hypothetical protein